MTEKGKTEKSQRLKDLLLAGKMDLNSDEMLLELILNFSEGQKDVKPIAEELFRVFGRLSKVFSATEEELEEITGLNKSSVVLFKLIHSIMKKEAFINKNPSPEREMSSEVQSKLFEQLPNEETQDKSFSIPLRKKRVELNNHVADKRSKKKANSLISQDGPLKSEKRKFQVSNGYLLEFDQLARILNFLLENRQAKKINRQVMQENTGLADRQVESLISIGSAMGLIKPGYQILTPTGLLIAEHDIFLEKTGSLEWCHYVGAGSFRNLIWFEIFNNLLNKTTPMTQEIWINNLRSDLAGKYGKRTISKGLYEEVRFVVDAYIEQNFKNLEILQRTSDESLYRRRYTQFSPLVISAMIYDFCAAKGTHLFQVGEMAATPGSPAMVFGLDAASLREQVEGLHDHGWLRYETTHNLDQIRLKSGLSAISFLSAHFEDREPREDTKTSPGDIFQ